MEKREKKNSKLKIIIPIYLIVVVALASFIYLVPKFTNRYDDTYTAEYGTLEVGFDCECLVVRDERLHTSDEAGVLERVVSEGKAVRKNARIVNVGGTGYYNQVRGIVSYSYDGLENNLTPDTMKEISQDYIEASKDSMTIQEVKDEVVSGDVVFKIVNNQAWYLVTWVDYSKIKSLKVGSSVTVRMGDEDVKMKVYFKDDFATDEDARLILSCNRIYDNYLSSRVLDCRVITKSKDGIIIETDSILVQDKEGGVMRVDKYGNANFVPIKILLQNDENQTVIEVLENSYFFDDEGNAVYTIKNYDTILRQKKQGSE